MASSQGRSIAFLQTLYMEPSGGGALSWEGGEGADAEAGARPLISWGKLTEESERDARTRVTQRK